MVCSHMRVRERNFSWEPEGERSLGRPRHKWKPTNKMDHKETGCEKVNWIQLA
jgi:hypothetical protein